MMNLYQLFKKAEKENFIKTVRLIAVKSGWCKILQHKEKKNERTILIKDKIRHQIFTEIARLAYEGDIEKEMDDLPYKILPGEIATYRDSIFLERAIVGERLRVAMGLPLRNISEHAPISKGVEASLIEEKYYEPPLINIIKFACNSLSGEACDRHRGLPGLSGTSLSGGLSQAGHPHGKRAVCDRSGEMHQMWKVSGILSI